MKNLGEIFQKGMCVLPKQNASDIARRAMLNENSPKMKIPEKCPKCGGTLVAGKTHKERNAQATEIVCMGCRRRYASIDMKIPVPKESENEGRRADLAWKRFLGSTPLSTIRKPIAELVLPDKTGVDATDMGKYSDIFFSLESPVCYGWEQQPSLKDNDVLEAFQTLLEDLNSQPEGSFAWLLATSLKARLLFCRGRGERDFTLGEVLSCIRLLIHIAREHENSAGDGYLRWVRAFFTTGLPQTPEGSLGYLLENEL